MGDDHEALTTDQPLPPQLSHSRLLIIMAVLIVAGAAAGAALLSGRFGMGVIVGGVFSYVNYFWQRNSTRALFDSVASGQRPHFLAVRYLLRYVVIGAFVGFFYLTGALPVAAVIMGLAAFALAVVVEGIKGVFTSSNKQGS